jgi:hypothetical protein
MMRELLLGKIHSIWNDNSAIEFNIELSEIPNLNDTDLFELFQQILTNSLTSQNERYKEELKRLYGIERPFICGWAGDKNEDGFNEFVLVSQGYGEDKFIAYKRHKD